jgi:hypothetical protein
MFLENDLILSPLWKRGVGAFFSRSGKVFYYEAGSRDLFELRHAHWLINSWDLQAISLFPRRGEGI